MMENAGEAVLKAIADLRADLKQYTKTEIDRLYESQETRFQNVEDHLERLNGKVAEHEKRFWQMDGAEQLKAKQRQMAILKLDDPGHDSGELPRPMRAVSAAPAAAAAERTPFYREILANRFLVAMLTLIVIVGMFILGGQGIIHVVEKWGAK